MASLQINKFYHVAIVAIRLYIITVKEIEAKFKRWLIVDWCHILSRIWKIIQLTWSLLASKYLETFLWEVQSRLTNYYSMMHWDLLRICWRVARWQSGDKYVGYCVALWLGLNRMYKQCWEDKRCCRQLCLCLKEMQMKSNFKSVIFFQIWHSRANHEVSSTSTKPPTSSNTILTSSLLKTTKR
jgi:hypothetical protein